MMEVSISKMYKDEIAKEINKSTGNKEKRKAMLEDVYKYLNLENGHMYKELEAYKAQDHEFLKTMTLQEIQDWCILVINTFNECLAVTPEMEEMMNTIEKGLKKDELVITGSLKGIREIVQKAISNSFQSKAKLYDLMPQTGEKFKKTHQDNLKAISEAKELVVKFS